MKLILDYLDQDAYVAGLYSKSEWNTLIDAFIAYTPIFVDNLFQDINKHDLVAMDDQVQDFINDVISPDAEIDFNKVPPFSTAFFSQYLTLPETLQRPLGQPHTPKRPSTPSVVIKSQDEPHPLPIEPDLKSDTSASIEESTKEKDGTLDELGFDFEEPKTDDDTKKVDETPQDSPLSQPTQTPGEAAIAAARMESTAAYNARKDAEEAERIANDFRSFEILYRNQMLSILSSRDEMAQLKLTHLGTNLTEFKFDEISDNVRRMLIDGFLDNYDKKIDSGQFDPGDYVIWADLDAAMIDNPETFPKLIQHDLREMMQAVMDDLT